MAEGHNLLANPMKRVVDRAVVGRATIVTQHVVIGYQCDCGCMKGIYETKILGGSRDGQITRCHSLENAKKRHATTVVLEELL